MGRVTERIPSSKVLLYHPTPIHRKCTNTNRTLSLLVKRGAITILPLLNNIQNNYYTTSRLDLRNKTTHLPPDTKQIILKASSSTSLLNPTTKINSSQQVFKHRSLNQVKLMGAKTLLSIHTDKASATGAVLVSLWPRCVRVALFFTGLLFRLEETRSFRDLCRSELRTCSPQVKVRFARSSFVLFLGNADVSGPIGLTRHSSDSSLRPSVPRGPPRKPKQSGHALWVGNLPPGTYIADLKDHFSRDATKDIESVFLISKSNCAFVNYKSESACAAAMTRFHDSRFQGVRLVCRLRRGSAATSTGTPTGPSSAPGSYDVGELRGPVTGEVSQQVAESEPLEDGITSEGPQPAATKAKEKFFVVKSLTVEDLEMSVRNGIWATQAHNETALNKAYEVSIDF